MVFTGDILLSREVLKEIEYKKQSPWFKMGTFLSSADWVLGNLEGAVGDPKQCASSKEKLCFATPTSLIPLLKEAGFSALGIENNHSADLNDDGRIDTEQALTANRIFPLTFDQSPGFLRLKDKTVAFITLTHVAGKDAKKVEIPSSVLLQKLRLARALANWVVIYIHWGSELSDWPHTEQYRQAEWMIRNGADLIVGHHPHVVQKPECILGKPVFFSLGNHVFDQKYPLTKNGLLADCQIKENKLICDAMSTQTPANSSFPALKKAAYELKNCEVPATPSIKIGEYLLQAKVGEKGWSDGEIVLEGRKGKTRLWQIVAKKILSMELAQFNTNTKEQLLFSLEKHPSSIDQELGTRPYVYQVTAHGIVAKWRGSALAWPLLDAKIITISSQEKLLCALHRKDSFLLLDPTSKTTRTAVYRWNGFGFTGVDAVDFNAVCKNYFSF